MLEQKAKQGLLDRSANIPDKRRELLNVEAVLRLSKGVGKGVCCFDLGLCMLVDPGVLGLRRPSELPSFAGAIRFSSCL